jgi:outer membrane protein OmpA-like peptidoglycan-associated protein
MKNFIKALTILFVCLMANPLLGADCSELSKQIAPNKNNPAELRKLLETNPQCGEIYEALGDYYYQKQVWNEAYDNYKKASEYFPEKSKLAARLQELRPKVTTMIESEQQMLAYKRQLAGTTPALPGSSPTVTSPPAPGPEAERTAAASQPKASAPSKKGADRKLQLASKSTSASQQPSAQARAKADKVGLMILFEFNSAELTPEGKSLLANFAEVLNTELAGRIFLINGHCDNVGTRDYNLGLSRERAKSVKAYLATKGVDSSRLDVRGYGFEKPIFDNDTESGRSKNRRVEFEEK